MNRYTHVLKTDDDCYVRLDALTAALRHGQLPWGAVGDHRGVYQLQGVYTGKSSLAAAVITRAAYGDTPLLY